MARVVDRVSLEVWPGEIVGLIGESGSGKTISALSALGLAPRGASIVGGCCGTTPEHIRVIKDKISF